MASSLFAKVNDDVVNNNVGIRRYIIKRNSKINFKLESYKTMT